MGVEDDVFVMYLTSVCGAIGPILNRVEPDLVLEFWQFCWSFVVVTMSFETSTSIGRRLKKKLEMEKANRNYT